MNHWFWFYMTYYHFFTTLFGHGVGGNFFYFTNRHVGSCIYLSIYTDRSDRSTYRFTPWYISTNSNGINSYGYDHVLFGRIKIKYKLSFGEMAEWLIAPVLKTGIVLNKELSRVRIPLSPFSRWRDFFLYWFCLARYHIS